METPFALQGYLANSKSNCKAHVALPRTKFSKPSYDKRMIHTSRTLCESSKAAFANRPLSPHIALKKPQLSATYSISHRILGAALAGAVMLGPVAMKFSLLCDV